MPGKPLPIYGDDSSVHDWLYVEDHADALLLAVERGEIGRTYNIGGENELSNLQLVLLDDCCHIWPFSLMKATLQFSQDPSRPQLRQK